MWAWNFAGLQVGLIGIRVELLHISSILPEHNPSVYCPAQTMSFQRSIRQLPLPSRVSSHTLCRHSTTHWFCNDLATKSAINAKGTVVV